MVAMMGRNKALPNNKALPMTPPPDSMRPSLSLSTMSMRMDDTPVAPSPSSTSISRARGLQITAVTGRLPTSRQVSGDSADATVTPPSTSHGHSRTASTDTLEAPIRTNGTARYNQMHNYEMTQQAHQVPMERTNSSTPSLKIMKTKHKPPKLKAAGKDYMDARGVLIRPMTNHERYQLVRQNIGRPQAIVHVLPYASEYAPSRAFFDKRVVDLQARLPRLYARPIDVYTNHPGFEPGTPYPPEAIISEGMFTPMPFDHGEEMATIMRHEMDVFESLNFHSSAQPYWSVRLLYGPHGCTRTYVVVAYNHCIVDPRGALRLLHALTMRSIQALVPEPFEIPTRLDDTVRMKPSTRYLAPMAFRELVVPKLPKIIQRKLVKEDPWPGASVTRSPLTSGWNISWSAVPEATVQELKRRAKARGINNMHSLLKAAYVASMWRVFGPNWSVPFQALAGTVIDERQPKLGHAFVTGVYNSVVECELKLTGNERWWNYTNDIAQTITSSRAISDGRMTIGVLSAIPDPEVDHGSADFDQRTPTGWEKYFVERATGMTPFRSSIVTYNIGTTSLPEDALDWIWSQTASPVGPVYYINFIGHEGGIRMTTSFCDGAAVTKFQTDVVHAMWLRVLERVANGEGDKTLSELTR